MNTQRPQQLQQLWKGHPAGANQLSRRSRDHSGLRQEERVSPEVTGWLCYPEPVARIGQKHVRTVTCEGSDRCPKCVAPGWNPQ